MLQLTVGSFVPEALPEVRIAAVDPSLNRVCTVRDQDGGAKQTVDIYRSCPIAVGVTSDVDVAAVKSADDEKPISVMTLDTAGADAVRVIDVAWMDGSTCCVLLRNKSGTKSGLRFVYLIGDETDDGSEEEAVVGWAAMSNAVPLDNNVGFVLSMESDHIRTAVLFGGPGGLACRPRNLDAPPSLDALSEEEEEELIIESVWGIRGDGVRSCVWVHLDQVLGAIQLQYMGRGAFRYTVHHRIPLNNNLITRENGFPVTRWAAAQRTVFVQDPEFCELKVWSLQLTSAICIANVPIPDSVVDIKCSADASLVFCICKPNAIFTVDAQRYVTEFRNSSAPRPSAHTGGSSANSGAGSGAPSADFVRTLCGAELREERASCLPWSSFDRATALKRSLFANAFEVPAVVLDENNNTGASTADDGGEVVTTAVEAGLIADIRLVDSKMTVLGTNGNSALLGLDGTVLATFCDSGSTVPFRIPRPPVPEHILTLRITANGVVADIATSTLDRDSLLRNEVHFDSRTNATKLCSLNGWDVEQIRAKTLQLALDDSAGAVYDAVMEVLDSEDPPHLRGRSEGAVRPVQTLATLCQVVNAACRRNDHCPDETQARRDLKGLLNSTSAVAAHVCRRISEPLPKDSFPALEKALLEATSQPIPVPIAMPEAPAYPDGRITDIVFLISIMHGLGELTERMQLAMGSDLSAAQAPWHPPRSISDSLPFQDTSFLWEAPPLTLSNEELNQLQAESTPYVRGAFSSRMSTQRAVLPASPLQDWKAFKHELLTRLKGAQGSVAGTLYFVNCNLHLLSKDICTQLNRLCFIGVGVQVHQTATGSPVSEEEEHTIPNYFGTRMMEIVANDEGENVEVDGDWQPMTAEHLEALATHLVYEPLVAASRMYVGGAPSASPTSTVPAEPPASTSFGTPSPIVTSPASISNQSFTGIADLESAESRALAKKEALGEAKELLSVLGNVFGPRGVKEWIRHAIMSTNVASLREMLVAFAGKRYRTLWANAVEESAYSICRLLTLISDEPMSEGSTQNAFSAAAVAYTEALHFSYAFSARLKARHAFQQNSAGGGQQTAGAIPLFPEDHDGDAFVALDATQSGEDIPAWLQVSPGRVPQMVNAADVSDINGVSFSAFSAANHDPQSFMVRRNLTPPSYLGLAVGWVAQLLAADKEKSQDGENSTTYSERWCSALFEHLLFKRRDGRDIEPTDSVLDQLLGDEQPSSVELRGVAVPIASWFDRSAFVRAAVSLSTTHADIGAASWLFNTLAMKSVDCTADVLKALETCRSSAAAASVVVGTSIADTIQRLWLTVLDLTKMGTPGESLLSLLQKHTDVPLGQLAPLVPSKAFGEADSESQRVSLVEALESRGAMKSPSIAFDLLQRARAWENPKIREVASTNDSHRSATTRLAAAIATKSGFNTSKDLAPVAIHSALHKARAEMCFADGPESWVSAIDQLAGSYVVIANSTGGGHDDYAIRLLELAVLAGVSDQLITAVAGEERDGPLANAKKLIEQALQGARNEELTALIPNGNSSSAAGKLNIETLRDDIVSLNSTNPALAELEMSLGAGGPKPPDAGVRLNVLSEDDVTAIVGDAAAPEAMAETLQRIVCSASSSEDESASRVKLSWQDYLKGCRPYAAAQAAYEALAPLDANTTADIAKQARQLAIEAPADGGLLADDRLLAATGAFLAALELQRAAVEGEKPVLREFNRYCIDVATLRRILEHSEGPGQVAAVRSLLQQLVHPASIDNDNEDEVESQRTSAQAVHGALGAATDRMAAAQGGAELDVRDGVFGSHLAAQFAIMYRLQVPALAAWQSAVSALLPVDWIGALFTCWSAQLPAAEAIAAGLWSLTSLRTAFVEMLESPAVVDAPVGADPITEAVKIIALTSEDTTASEETVDAVDGLWERIADVAFHSVRFRSEMEASAEKWSTATGSVAQILAFGPQADSTQADAVLRHVASAVVAAQQASSWTDAQNCGDLSDTLQTNSRNADIARELVQCLIHGGPASALLRRIAVVCLPTVNEITDATIDVATASAALRVFAALVDHKSLSTPTMHQELTKALTVMCSPAANEGCQQLLREALQVAITTAISAPHSMPAKHVLPQLLADLSVATNEADEPDVPLVHPVVAAWVTFGAEESARHPILRKLFANPSTLGEGLILVSGTTLPTPTALLETHTRITGTLRSQVSAEARATVEVLARRVYRRWNEAAASLSPSPQRTNSSSGLLDAGAQSSVAALPLSYRQRFIDRTRLRGTLFSAKSERRPVLEVLYDELLDELDPDDTGNMDGDATAMFAILCAEELPEEVVTNDTVSFIAELQRDRFDTRKNDDGSSSVDDTAALTVLRHVQRLLSAEHGELIPEALATLQRAVALDQTVPTASPSLLRPNCEPFLSEETVARVAPTMASDVFFKQWICRNFGIPADAVGHAHGRSGDLGETSASPARLAYPSEVEEYLPEAMRRALRESYDSAPSMDPQAQAEHVRRQRMVQWEIIRALLNRQEADASDAVLEFVVFSTDLFNRDADMPEQNDGGGTEMTVDASLEKMFALCLESVLQSYYVPLIVENGRRVFQSSQRFVSRLDDFEAAVEEFFYEPGTCQGLGGLQETRGWSCGNQLAIICDLLRKLIGVSNSTALSTKYRCPPSSFGRSLLDRVNGFQDVVNLPHESFYPKIFLEPLAMFVVHGHWLLRDTYETELAARISHEFATVVDFAVREGEVELLRKIIFATEDATLLKYVVDCIPAKDLSTLANSSETFANIPLHDSSVRVALMVFFELLAEEDDDTSQYLDMTTLYANFRHFTALGEALERQADRMIDMFVEQQRGTKKSLLDTNKDALRRQGKALDEIEAKLTSAANFFVQDAMHERCFRCLQRLHALSVQRKHNARDCLAINVQQKEHVIALMQQVDDPLQVFSLAFAYGITSVDDWAAVLVRQVVHQSRRDLLLAYKAQCVSVSGDLLPRIELAIASGESTEKSKDKKANHAWMIDVLTQLSGAADNDPRVLAASSRR